MDCLIPLLVALCALTAFGAVHDYTYDDFIDPESDNEPISNKWRHLLNTTAVCGTARCANGGICQETREGGLTCHCPEPFTGSTCQDVKSHCIDGMTCRTGSCLFQPLLPYYECKCNYPYKPLFCTRHQGPVCTHGDNNPCKNGGTCVRGRTPTRPSFTCSCPSGYTGKLCEVEPYDCIQGDGQSYRGKVSVTAEGDECQNWNSYFVLEKAGDLRVMFPDFDGLGPHNFCRNPNGDSQPWCFIKQNRKLQWKYCNIRQCPTVRPSQEFPECGNPEVVMAPRIFGGKKSLTGQIPWQASIQVREIGSSGNFRHHCGGILLSSCWVLTAAHCINDTHERQVVLGRVHLDKPEDFDQTIQVEKVIVHENFRRARNALHNDIAMLKLNVTDKTTCAKESRYVKTACLPNRSFPSGTECVVSGWGRTETKDHNNELLSADVLLISKKNCTDPNVRGDVLDDGMLCAGFLEEGVDSCKGDSGGPLMCEHDGIHYVTGVVSWGKECAVRNKPGVYANVIKFFPWIISHLNS